MSCAVERLLVVKDSTAWYLRRVAPHLVGFADCQCVYSKL
jgi:hypothetical protein